MIRVAHVPSGRVDQFHSQTMPIDTSVQIVASRSGCAGNEGRLAPHEGIKQCALSRVGKPGQNDSRPTGRLHPRFTHGEQRVHFPLRLRDAARDFVGGYELNILVDEIKAGLEIGQQIEQGVPESDDTSRDAAG